MKVTITSDDEHTLADSKSNSTPHEKQVRCGQTKLRALPFSEKE
jgi:hypothetical protein